MLLLNLFEKWKWQRLYSKFEKIKPNAKIRCETMAIWPVERFRTKCFKTNQFNAQSLKCSKECIWFGFVLGRSAPLINAVFQCRAEYHFRQMYNGNGNRTYLSIVHRWSFFSYTFVFALNGVVSILKMAHVWHRLPSPLIGCHIDTLFVWAKLNAFQVCYCGNGFRFLMAKSK